MDEKQLKKEQAEIAEAKKLQAAFDAKLAKEVDSLLEEAKKAKVEVPDSTRNPEAIKKLIEAASPKPVKKEKGA